MIATIPATIRVETRYSTGRIAHRLQRVDLLVDPHRPQLRGHPAPKVAANPIPATTGAEMRTLINAAKNPVSASIPILPNEL